MRSFKSLSEREILALAITLEEEDERIYADYAEGLRKDYPGTAAVFEGMRQDESGHRRRLIELFQAKFGEHIPLIRRHDVSGFVQRRPLWLIRPLGMDKVRNQVVAMEEETRRFYEKAASRAGDASIRQLLNDLAQEERSHQHHAESLEEKKLQPDIRADENEAGKRLFVLRIVQPGLVGLMDGSVSTLAPVFAAALATRSSHDAFTVGLAASLGAGISMGFAEALSDDGSLTGRGQPWFRGLVCGLTDRARRHRSHLAVPHRRLSHCHGRRDHRCRGRVGHHYVDPQSLYGYASALGRPAGRIRRPACVCDRRADWKCVIP